MKPEQFIKEILPYAEKTFTSTGIPVSFTLAQAALESGWGESKLAKEAKNLFGIKANSAWTGQVMYMPTREYINGAWVQEIAKWRAYPDWQGSLDDHAQFFRANSRYAACFKEGTGKGWAQAVAKAGYATDPEYAAKLTALIDRYGLESYDTSRDTPVTSPGLLGAIKAFLELFKHGREIANGASLQNKTALAAGITGVLTTLAVLSKSMGIDLPFSTDDLAQIGSSVAVLFCVIAPIVRSLGSARAGIGPRSPVPVLSNDGRPEWSRPGSNA